MKFFKKCFKKKKPELKPGEILDQVISQSSATANKCLLYKLANFKGGLYKQFLGIFWSESGSTGTFLIGLKRLRVMVLWFPQNIRWNNVIQYTRANKCYYAWHYSIIGSSLSQWLIVRTSPLVLQMMVVGLWFLKNHIFDTYQYKKSTKIHHIGQIPKQN